MADRDWHEVDQMLTRLGMDRTAYQEILMMIISFLAIAGTMRRLLRLRGALFEKYLENQRRIANDL